MYFRADPDFYPIRDVEESAAWGRTELWVLSLSPHANISFLQDNDGTLVGSETHTSALYGDVPPGLSTHTAEASSWLACWVSNGLCCYHLIESAIEYGENLSRLSALRSCPFILPSVSTCADLIRDRWSTQNRPASAEVKHPRDDLTSGAGVSKAKRPRCTDPLCFISSR